MNLLSSPKNKILAASALLLALGAAATASGLNAAGIARVAIGCGAVGGLAWWFTKGRQQRAAAGEKPRLEVIARSGLSQRTALALVEVDGKPFLVVHGDGFAEVCQPATRRRTAKRQSFKAALRSVP